jgi:DNA invertase Pin-like site-specific DNA recombinase
MAYIGYVFLALEREQRLPLAEQQQAIDTYSTALGKKADVIFVEQGVSLKQAFVNRKEGKKIFEGLQTGDALFVTRAAYILASSREAGRLLQALRKKGVSLFCLDLDEDISLDRERKLVVSRGGAQLVQQLLDALALCDSCRHGEAIRATKKLQKREGKYLGGPVPYGWQIGDNGFLVQHLEQQRIIREMLKFREERWSYRDIARKLMEKYNLDLSHEGIRRILEVNARKKIEERERVAVSHGRSNINLQRHSPLPLEPAPGKDQRVHKNQET